MINQLQLIKANTTRTLDRLYANPFLEFQQSSYDGSCDFRPIDISQLEQRLHLLLRVGKGPSVEVSLLARHHPHVEHPFVRLGLFIDQQLDEIGTRS